MHYNLLWFIMSYSYLFSNLSPYLLDDWCWFSTFQYSSWRSNDMLFFSSTLACLGLIRPLPTVWPYLNIWCAPAKSRFCNQGLNRLFLRKTKYKSSLSPMFPFYLFCLTKDILLLMKIVSLKKNNKQLPLIF